MASSLPPTPGVSGVSASPQLAPASSASTTSSASPPQPHDDLSSEFSTTALLTNPSRWGTNPTQYQPSCETIPLQYPETSSLQYSELTNLQMSEPQYSDLDYQTGAPQYQPSYETITTQYSEPDYQSSPPHYTKLVYGTNTPLYTTPACHTSPLQQYQPNFEASTMQYSEPPPLETFPAPSTFSVAGCEPTEQPTVAAPATSPTMYYDASCPDSPHHLQYSQL